MLTLRMCDESRPEVSIHGESAAKTSMAQRIVSRARNSKQTGKASKGLKLQDSGPAGVKVSYIHSGLQLLKHI